MTDPQVFYNQEDLWEPPDEMYGDNRQKMKPYYIIIKLPEGDNEEFLLMLSGSLFSPLFPEDGIPDIRECLKKNVHDDKREDSHGQQYQS